MLWGMINALQLIVHLPMFSVVFPANAQFVFSLIIGLTKFNIIPVDSLISFYLIFTDYEEDEIEGQNF